MNKKHLFVGVVLLSLLVVGLAKAITVTIDVKPGDDTNVVNLGSKGLIPVAILTEVDEFGNVLFDASDVQIEDSVERAGILLNGVDVAVRGKAEKSMSRLEDVNGDGYLDVLFQVETDRLNFDVYEYGTVVLNGFTYNGVPITGSDEVTIVPPQ